MRKDYSGTSCGNLETLWGIWGSLVAVWGALKRGLGLPLLPRRPRNNSGPFHPHSFFGDLRKLWNIGRRISRAIFAAHGSHPVELKNDPSRPQATQDNLRWPWLGGASLLGHLLAVLGRSSGLCVRSWVALGAYFGVLGLLLGPMLMVLARSWGVHWGSWAERCEEHRNVENLLFL